MNEKQIKRFRRLLLCKFGIHSWDCYQECVRTNTNYGDNNRDLVIAFNICSRCAKSKLVHILV